MLLGGFQSGGKLSYGLFSCGLLVLSKAGDLPRLADRSRSAARENLPVRVLSFSLRPLLWLIVLLECCCWDGAGGGSLTGLGTSGLSSSSSITISITPEPRETPDPWETPETMEFVIGLWGRYRGGGGGGGGMARCCNSLRIGGAGGGGGGGGVRSLFEGLIGWVLASIVSSIPLMIPGIPLA